MRTPPSLHVGDGRALQGVLMHSLGDIISSPMKSKQNRLKKEVIEKETVKNHIF